MKSESCKNLPSLTQTICLLNLSSTKRSQHMPGKLPSSAHTYVYRYDRNWSKRSSYFRSKLCMNLFSVELARKLESTGKIFIQYNYINMYLLTKLQYKLEISKTTWHLLNQQNSIQIFTTKKTLVRYFYYHYLCNDGDLKPTRVDFVKWTLF